MSEVAAYRERKGRVDGRDAALVGEEEEIIKNVKTVSHFPNVCVYIVRVSAETMAGRNVMKQN